MRMALLMCLLPIAALAQVTTNDQALEALKPAAPASAPAATPAPARAKQAVSRLPAHHASRKPAAPHEAAAHAATALPAVPAGPPPNPVIVPPPPALPEHVRETPPPVPIKPDAIGTVTLIEGGARLTFGPGSADLNPQTEAALRLFAVKAKQDRLVEIILTAWAPGTDADPSTPRRLALDRALAGRAVLIHEGVDSERIHAVAKGYVDIGAPPPDRMDVIAQHPAATPAGAPK